jgi:hypothetical protein
MTYYFFGFVFLLLTQIAHATDAHPDIPLDARHVAHTTDKQLANRKEISLEKLAKTQSSFQVVCEYKVIGSSKKTDVGFNIPGGQLINVDEDYNPYPNTGLTKRKGKLLFTLDQNDLKYGKAIVITNYDHVNDINISNCIASWLDG